MNLAFYRAPGVGPLDDRDFVARTAKALEAHGHAVTIYYDGQREPKGPHDLVILVDFPPAAVLNLAPRQWLWLTAGQPFDPAAFEWVVVPNDFALRSLAGRHPVLSGKVIAITDEGVAFWERLIADPVVPRTGCELAQIPDTPTHLLPNPQKLAPSMVQEAVRQWIDAAKPARVSADHVLGLPLPGIGASSDGVVVGWSLEDAQQAPADFLRQCAITDGVPVLVLTSYGPWRAGIRRRCFSRRDVVEVFGKQPDVGLRAIPIDGDGNGFIATAFRYAADALGQRDLTRVRATSAPRETVTVTTISRHVADDLFPRMLQSIRPIADEVVVCVNGTKKEPTPMRPLTEEVLHAFTKETGIPHRVVEGTAPRHCFDCQVEHPIGDMMWGHRFAGFETPRNESISVARGDWILWLDSDEGLEGAGSMHKYLRPNCFAAYSVPQHHHSVDPPAAGKIDLPVRLFRRQPDGEAGWITVGPHAWPTYHSGLSVRFAGIVHEHPGFKPTYAEGIGPVVVLSDVWIAHTGYYTEAGRRGRFIRNWPLMAADRMKYPDRRLGIFLWLRDLSHHLRYRLEQQRNQITPEIHQLAMACAWLWRTYFLNQVDAFTGDAHQYASAALQVLQSGMEFRLQAEFWKPEISGEEKAVIQIAGRIEDFDQSVELLKARKGETTRWTGRYL